MPTQQTASGVKTRRPELRDVMDRYNRISDALEGEHAIKKRALKTYGFEQNHFNYLPVPSDCSGKADPRYLAYIARAVYYNVCQPTRDALVGQIFLRPPMVELDDRLQFLIDDMNGEGLTLEQMARRAANYVVPFGRGGFLADFPNMGGREVTNQDIANGVRPIIKFYEPWSIRNWVVEKRGNVEKIVMLVLDEAFEKVSKDDEFNVEIVIHQRVYRLQDAGEVNGVQTYCCTVEVFDDEGESIDSYNVCGQDGTPLQQIPFEPIGSEDNDMNVDDPPFTGLANLNIAHFRNSADYEESAFIVGQPTLFYGGFTDDWMENYYKDGIPFGSRASVAGPENSDATVLQADPNTLAFEAMTHKEDQMFSIGAKIINRDQKVEKKEAEVEIEAASQKSVLMNVRNNLQMALFAAVKHAASFIGVDVTEGTHKIELNENFDLTSASPDEIRASSELYQLGEISFKERREQLLRSGVASITDHEEARTEITADKALKEAVRPNEPEPVGGGGGDGNTQTKADNNGTQSNS